MSYTSSVYFHDLTQLLSYLVSLSFLIAECNSCTFSSQSLPPLVRVVISSDDTESGDPSHLNGQNKDDGHASKASSDGWTVKKIKLKTETEEREHEEDNDQSWPTTGAKSTEKRDGYDDGSLGEELNQTQSKKNSKKSLKRKRDDSADTSIEYTFINHLGAYTGQFNKSIFLCLFLFVIRF